MVIHTLTEVSIEDVIIIVLSDVTCRSVMKPLCLSVLTCTASVSNIISLEWKERRKQAKQDVERERKWKKGRERERGTGEKKSLQSILLSCTYNTCTSSVLSLSLSLSLSLCWTGSVVVVVLQYEAVLQLHMYALRREKSTLRHSSTVSLSHRQSVKNPALKSLTCTVQSHGYHSHCQK